MLTDEEALEAAVKRSSGLEYLSSVDAYSAGFHAALVWLRSQGEPVAVTTSAQIKAMANGAERGVFARDPKFAAMAPRDTDIPLYLAPQPAIPDGWKLVPVEPTWEMTRAGFTFDVWKCSECGTQGGLSHNKLSQLYHEMLAAAPEPSK